MKPRNKRPSFPNKKLRGLCECREYIFIKDQLVCKNCGSPMKSEKKPITTKGARHKSGLFNK